MDCNIINCMLFANINIEPQGENLMKLSSEELEQKKLKPQTLDLAIQQVRANGYVVFGSVLEKNLVDTLRSCLMELLSKYTAKTDSNRGKNRYQMHLPFSRPFTNPQIITNPIALLVIDAIIGSDCICHYLASDTPLPKSEYQHVHSDIHRLFPSRETTPPYSVSMNIPLVDFTRENGAMEIWPGGTHLMPNGIDMSQLSKTMHSELVLMPAGSLLIRDMRMWHRGTPNRSNAARPNMAFIFSRYWFKTSYPPIGISQETYKSLSDRAKQLFRHEQIGDRSDPRF